MLALAAASGLPLPSIARTSEAPSEPYSIRTVGNVHLMHITDVHAQLLPVHYREPALNIGVHGARNRPPHLVGEALLKHYKIALGSRAAHALTHLDYVAAATQYGRVGGFSHLATLIKRLRADRPGALLLDGGDLWQGSATALWTEGQDMVDASQLLGVDVMTGHWEFTLGAERVMDILDNELEGQIEFIAHNVKDMDFGDPIFASHTLREMNGVPVAIIGQAFPYTPIANPAYFTPGWTFGIQERELQEKVNEVKAAGAQVVVLLSHNGADADIKLASRVSGIDAILGGHTHDAIPRPLEIANPEGVTLVTNAGSNGKFIGVLDFTVRGGRIRDWSYELLPVFAELLPPDPDMEALIARIRAPFLARLNEPLARTDALLYRRGNFNGSMDQLICDALMEEMDAPIALSPGFRWGTTLLPGEIVTMEHLMSQVAITYPEVTLTEMTGARLKQVLEDVADNLFHPDPYYQQGGDMVRAGGLQYAIAPLASIGSRITDLSLNGEPIEAEKTYKVAGWASIQKTQGEAIWDVVSRWLRREGQIGALTPNVPAVTGLANNLGLDLGC